ncbi:MAG TPA: hypothetical protein VF796_04710 [Humisphaera sp.]
MSSPAARLARVLILFAVTALAPAIHADPAPATRPAAFSLKIVDAATGRGVPLVELKTTSSLRLYTDSGGYVAIDDPALLGRRVFFSVASHGYQFPADGFGIRGRAVELTPGGSAEWKIERRNVAERLYRVTGEGIYAESVKLGLKPPIDQPLLDAQVTGQDSVQSVIYKGKAYWFWGDTNRQSYALGHFGTACATSDLPEAGGLEPGVGVNLKYLAGPDGFSRGAFEKQGATLFWMDGAFVVKDATGGEHLLATVSLMKSLSECVGRRLVEWDDATARFKTIRDFPADARARPHGHALEVKVKGRPFIYLGDPQPDVRIQATYEAATDLANYQAYTCILPADGGPARIDRDADGKAKYDWRRDADRMGRDEFDALRAKGVAKPDDLLLRPVDAETKKEVRLHAGSVRWNDYRRRYVMIANQFGGKSSFLGEVYYLESDAPEGPWAKAVKVVTHDRYSFYNPCHHAFLDRDGGRTIHFEGTYAATFSRQGDETPRYDYNQVMYKLDLDDPRLKAVR